MKKQARLHLLVGIAAAELPERGNRTIQRRQAISRRYTAKESIEFRYGIVYNLDNFYILATRRSQMHAISQNILEAFNQLPDIEKHALASEIIKQVAMLDIPPLTDEALTEIADALFVEHDRMEAEDAEAKSRGSLAR